MKDDLREHLQKVTGAGPKVVALVMLFELPAEVKVAQLAPFVTSSVTTSLGTQSFQKMALIEVLTGGRCADLGEAETAIRDFFTGIRG